MILPIVAFGAPILRKKCSDISEDYPEFNSILANMWETMYEANGVGLAAPQINRDIRLFLIDTTPFFEEEEEKEEEKRKEEAEERLTPLRAFSSTMRHQFVYLLTMWERSCLCLTLTPRETPRERAHHSFDLFLLVLRSANLIFLLLSCCSPFPPPPC